MNKKLVLDQIRNYVRSRYLHDSSGHDWYHIDRVVRTSKKIGRIESADMFLLEVAAWLHEINDWKNREGNGEQAKEVKRILVQLDVPTETIRQIFFVANHISYRGQQRDDSGKNILECRVIRDADRLDAIGAIGIARTFAFGGSRGLILYDPDIKPCKVYGEKISATSINHFYEKLLKLKNCFYTRTGKSMARSRFNYLDGYLKQFLKEWNGKI